MIYKKHDHFSEFWKDATTLNLSVKCNLHTISDLSHDMKFIHCENIL